MSLLKSPIVTLPEISKSSVKFKEKMLTKKIIFIDKALKRTFDIGFSLFALLLSSFIMIIIAFFIKIKSPNGSILFKQKRLGLNGKYFYLYKFRTMVPNAEAKLKLLLDSDEHIKKEYLKYRKLKNDIRIIPGIGSFLRKTSLDELPQFFNVLIGNMSTVGPRPYIKTEFYNYSQITVNKIVSVKPGITGYWQTIPSRHNTTFDDRVKTDMDYINKKNFWLDLNIIFKTIKVMVLRKGA